MIRIKNWSQETNCQKQQCNAIDVYKSQLKLTQVTFEQSIQYQQDVVIIKKFKENMQAYLNVYKMEVQMQNSFLKEQSVQFYFSFVLNNIFYSSYHYET
ncbi:hypothetical protein pb186bvf_000267 [Paramecium bursaria]